MREFDFVLSQAERAYDEEKLMQAMNLVDVGNHHTSTAFHHFDKLHIHKRSFTHKLVSWLETQHLS